MDDNKISELIYLSVKDYNLNDEKVAAIKSNIKKLGELMAIRFEDCIIDAYGNIWAFTNQSIIKSIVNTDKSCPNNVELFPYNSIVKVSISDNSDKELTMHVTLSSNNEDVHIEVMNKYFRIELLRIYKEKFL